MPRQPLLTLRVDPKAKAEWEAEARRLGLSLSELIRRRTNEGLGAPEIQPAAGLLGVVEPPA